MQKFNIQSESLGFNQDIYGYEAPKPEAVFDLMKQSVSQKQMLDLYNDDASEADKSLVREAVRHGFFKGEGTFLDGLEKAFDDVTGGLAKLPQSSERTKMMNEVLQVTPGSYERRPDKNYNFTTRFMRDFNLMSFPFEFKNKDTTELEKQFDADTLFKIDQASLRLVTSATDLSNQQKARIFNAEEEMIRARAYYDLPNDDRIKAIIASKAYDYSQKQGRADMFQGFAQSYAGYKMMADLGIKAYKSPGIMNPFTDWRNHSDDQIDTQINFLKETNKGMQFIENGAFRMAEIFDDIELANDLSMGRIKPDMQRAMLVELASQPDAYVAPFATAGVVRGKNYLRAGAVKQLRSEHKKLSAELAGLKSLRQSAIKHGHKGSLDSVIKGADKKIAEVEKNMSGIMAKVNKKETTGNGVLLGNRVAGRIAQGLGLGTEKLGRTLQFLRQLGPEALRSFLFKRGIVQTEKEASQIIGSIGLVAGAGAGYYAVENESTTPALAILATAFGPKILEDLGRSMKMYGEEALKMQRIMPYWKRIGASPADNPTYAGSLFDRETTNYSFLETFKTLKDDAFREKGLPAIGRAGARAMEFVPGTSLMNRQVQGAIAGAGLPMAIGYGLGGAEGAGAGLGAVAPFIAVGGVAGELMRFNSASQLKLKQMGQVKEYENSLSDLNKKDFQTLNIDERVAVAEASAYFPDVIIDFVHNEGGARGEYMVRDGEGYITINTAKTYQKGTSVLDAIVAHEVGHFIKSHNLHHVINDTLLGSTEKGTIGFFTKLDDNGQPIINKDDPLNPYYEVNEMFAEYKKATEEDVKNGDARHIGEKILVGGIKKDYMDKLMATKGVDPEHIRLYDEDPRMIAEEYFAEHQADRILTGKTRKIAMMGPYGKMIDSLGDKLLNSNFYRKLGLSVGGRTTIDGSKLLFFDKEKGKTNLVFNKQLDLISKEYERKSIGRTKDEIDREFGEKRMGQQVPKGEFEVRPQDYSNAQAMEHFNNGGILATNSDGTLKMVNGKAVLLPKKNQDQQSMNQANTLIEIIQKYERRQPEGLPDGHVTLYTTKDGKLRGTGRYLDPRVIDELENSGLYNPKQIKFLRMASEAGRRQQKGIHKDASINPEFFYDSFGNATRNPDYDPNQPLGDWEGPPKNAFLMMYYKAMGRDKKYKTIRGSMREGLVYGITVTKDANVIVDTIDRGQLEKNVSDLLKRKSTLNKAQQSFGINDKAQLTQKILSDLVDYTTEHHRNVVTGSDESQFTRDQANILNSAFGALRKSQIELNPILEGLGETKSQRMASVRSRRLDRIANMNDFGDGMHLNIRKIQNAMIVTPLLMPDDPGVRRARALGQQFADAQKSQTELVGDARKEWSTKNYKSKYFQLFMKGEAMDDPHFIIDKDADGDFRPKELYYVGDVGTDKISQDKSYSPKKSMDVYTNRKDAMLEQKNYDPKGKPMVMASNAKYILNPSNKTQMDFVIEQNPELAGVEEVDIGMYERELADMGWHGYADNTHEGAGDLVVIFDPKRIKMIESQTAETKFFSKDREGGKVSGLFGYKRPKVLGGRDTDVRFMPDDNRFLATGKNEQIVRDNKSTNFMPADEAFDYRGSHRAPDREYGAPLSDLTGTGMYPDDVYSQAGYRYYTDGGIMAVKAMDIAHEMRGKPDAEVTVYRAIPGEAVAQINPGDWVTTVKEYAQLHGEHVGLKNPTIVEEKVSAGDLFTEGNSILEYGYDPGAHVDPGAMFMPADIKKSQPLQREAGPPMLGVDFLYNDKVVLVGPYPMGRAPHRASEIKRKPSKPGVIRLSSQSVEPIMRGRFNIYERKEFDKANAENAHIEPHGYVEGSITDDGFFDALIDIRINKGVQKKGLGTDVVHSMAHHALDGELLIKDIQASAKKFWKKIGSEDFKPFTESGYKTRTEAKLRAPGPTRSYRPKKDSSMLMPGYGDEQHLVDAMYESRRNSLGLNDTVLTNLYPKMPGKITIQQFENMMRKDPALLDYNNDTGIVDEVKRIFGENGKMTKNELANIVNQFGPNLKEVKSQNYKGSYIPIYPTNMLNYRMSYYVDKGFSGKPYRKDVHRSPENTVFHDRGYTGDILYYDADGLPRTSREEILAEAQSDPHQDAKDLIDPSKPFDPKTNPKVGYESDRTKNLPDEVLQAQKDIETYDEILAEREVVIEKTIIPLLNKIYKQAIAEENKRVLGADFYRIDLEIPRYSENPSDAVIDDYNNKLESLQRIAQESPASSQLKMYDLRGAREGIEVLFDHDMSTKSKNNFLQDLDELGLSYKKEPVPKKYALRDTKIKYDDGEVVTSLLYNYNPIERSFTYARSDSEGYFGFILKLMDEFSNVHSKRGFKISGMTNRILQLFNESDFAKSNQYRFDETEFNILTQNIIEAYDIVNAHFDGGVSIDTYKKWVPKVIKARIMEAIQNGEDAFSILTGDEIGIAETSPTGASGIIYHKRDDGKYNISVQRNQDTIITKNDLYPKDVVHLLGKHIWEGYIKAGKGKDFGPDGIKQLKFGDANDQTPHAIRPNLKPFRQFYDGEMVNTVNKIAKKIGLKPMEHIPGQKDTTAVFNLKIQRDRVNGVVARLKAQAFKVKIIDRALRDVYITAEMAMKPIPYDYKVKGDNQYKEASSLIEGPLDRYLRATEVPFSEAVSVKFKDEPGTIPRNRLDLFPDHIPLDHNIRESWRRSREGKKWFNDISDKLTLHMPDDVGSSGGPPQSGSLLRQISEETLEVKQAMDADGKPIYKEKKDKDDNVVKDDQGNPVMEPVYETIGYNLEGSPLVNSFQGQSSSKIKYDVDALNYLNDAEKARLKDIISTGALDEASNRLETEMNIFLQDPDIKAGDGWYSRMRKKLQNALGDKHEMFAQLLGATSANTPVEANFMQAVEALEMFEAGKYDSLIETYLAGYDAYKNGNIAKFMHDKGMATKKETQKGDGSYKNNDTLNRQLFTRYVKGQNSKGTQVRKPLIPLRGNGKKYNKNSGAVMRVLAGSWLQLGDAPKTPNFAGNLTGRTLQATIDVWAGRLLRRLMYKGQAKWRIQPASETGVTNIDFAIGQVVFDEVGKRLGKNPDDLQAIAWFGEKDLWGKKNWTGDTGEFKSSFDEPFDAFFPENRPRESLREGSKIIEYHRAKRNKSKWESEKANPGKFLKKSGQKYTLDETKTNLKNARKRFRTAKNKNIVKKFLSGTR